MNNFSTPGYTVFAKTLTICCSKTKATSYREKE